MKLLMRARGKINWTLEVLGTREDGYHELDMLMESVSLCDLLTLESDEKLTLSVAHHGESFVPGDERNLVMKAAGVLQAATGCTKGARIHLRKYIPVAAGMGGGSSDAAAALVGLNHLWGTGLSRQELESLAVRVGADVPFCIGGGLQRVQGIGERLIPLAAREKMHLVAFQPCRGLSTWEVFSSVGTDECPRPDNDRAQAARLAGNPQELAKTLQNMLEPVSRRMRPQMEEGLQKLLKSGALVARLTGSGSVIYGLYPSSRSAKLAGQLLEESCAPVHVMCTEEAGVVMVEE